MASDYTKKFTDLVNYIPQQYQSIANTSLLSNLHDKLLTKEESTPLLGYIGDTIPNDNSPYIPAANLDRQINALVPSIYTKLGSEEYVFTFSDVLQKMSLLGINVDDFSTLGTATSFNFIPPIDLDKFSNYSRYRWYGNLVGTPTSYNSTMAAEYYVIGKGGVSDWSTHNYWVHEADADQFFTSKGYTFTINDTTQALRPIIEYDVALEPEMVLHISNGRPAATGTIVDQRAVGYKSEFNQKPLFNLYLYNGTHSGYVSPIFYYAEGNEYPIDSVLKKRIQVDVYGDYTFEHGLVTRDGLRILFYNNDGVNTIWKRGPDESPVYYVQDPNGVLVPTDPATDTLGVGAWVFPNQMFYNITHESRKQIGYGDLLGHFTDVIMAQPNFSGNPYGSNNYRNLGTYNLGLGGKIKDYSTNFSLFLGLINQLDSSVASIIEFGKLQYSQMLGSIPEFITKNFANALTDGLISAPNPQLSNTLDPVLAPLFASFLTYVTTRNDSTVFSDTTSAIPGWPATLPYLGLSKLTDPSIFFEKTLGSLVLRHHDSHLTIIQSVNTALDTSLANISYLRSDGQTTPGVVGYIAPSRPYKNQFWFDANTNSLKMYAIGSDSVKVYPGVEGTYFYDRVNDVLYQFSTTINDYVVVADKTLPWTVINTATAINQLTLMAEKKLHDGCPIETLKLDANAIITAQGTTATDYLALEYAVFAAEYGLDISAGDYVPTDAFTWNYSSVTVQGLSTPIARWFRIYHAYFGTQRPNLHPWILQGYTTKPTWWHSTYADTTGTRAWTTQMWTDIKNNTTPNHPAPTGAWTKKLGVDVLNDNLLPPYVSPTDLNSAEALLTSIPSGITNGYSFGEYGPTEMTWRISVDCNYDKLKVCFKLDPINFVNTVWGYNNVSIDGYEIDRHEHRKLSHHDFMLHGETPTTKFTGYTITGITQTSADTLWTLVCIANTPTGGIFSVTGNVSGLISASCVSGVPFTSTAINFTVSDLGTDFTISDQLLIAMPSTSVTYVPSNYAKYSGLNQWFVNLNRYNSVDMSIALADDIFRGWDLMLGHRMSGIVNTELFEINSDQFALHTTDYNIIIKENKNIGSYWLNALRIQLISIGSYDIVDGNLIPVNKGADWQFRIETFNTQNPSIQYYEFDPAGAYQTFFALGKLNSTDAWNHLLDHTQLVTVSTPFVITGIENVANVIFGYTDKLAEDGWAFNQSAIPAIDPITGRAINWQMNIERFINQQYTGVQAGTGIILNPFASSVWFNTPHGFVASLRNPTTSDITSAQSIFDSYGDAINNKDIQIFRNDDVTEIQSAVVMGGIHLLLDEYEHIILFQNYISDQSRQYLMYDPFLGARVNRLYLSTERQAVFNGRLSFGGHYIVNNQVRRNIEASIGDILNYYDSDNMIDNSSTAAYARGLLGYTPKSYMSDIGLSDKSQFGFWRGLISNKGSNFSVNAFLNSSRFESASIDEFWAYKLAEYGDARQLSFPEIKLSSVEAQNNYTKIQFAPDNVVGPSGFITINPSDEAHWISQEDQLTDLFFNAEQIGQVNFSNIWPGLLLDLAQNGKRIIADTVQVYEQVYSSTGDMTPFLIQVTDFVLVNSSTIQFTSATPTDSYVRPTPRQFTVNCFGPSQPKFNPAKLIDYKHEVIISDLALWDPARGAHTSEALELVDIINPQDPAKYSYSIQTANNINYDQYRPWDNKDVGKVWWNTKNLDYIPYSDVNIFPSLDVRLSYWGALADWSSIELYEWTESTSPPSTYAALVTVQEGDSSIDVNVRASGNVAMSELYSRTRSWQQQPVAWGYSDTPGSVVPYLNSVGEYSVTFSTDLTGNTIAILSSSDWMSTFTNLAIGMKISGGVFYYNNTDVTDVGNFKLTKPYGEAVVTGLNLGIVIGSSTTTLQPVFTPPLYTF